MSAGDAVNLFAFAFLIESDGSENGRQDHSRSMNPGQGLMKADLTVSLRSRNPGGENGEIGAREVQVAVAEPRARCAQRSLELVLLPAAPNEVATVAISGIVAIRPKR